MLLKAIGYHVLILITAFASCGDLQAGKLSKNNIAFLYAEQSNSNTRWMAYHVSDSKTTIYGEIHLEDFIYRHAWNNGGEQKAKFSVTYHLLDSYTSKEIIDSAEIVFSDSIGFGTSLRKIISFDVLAAYPGNYILEILLTDFNSPGNRQVSILRLNKESRFSAQNFMILNEYNEPVFDPYLNQFDRFILKYNDPGISAVNIRYYNREFPLAKPPFSIDRRETYTFKPDSLYMIELTDGLSQMLDFPFKGIYFIQPSEDVPEGITLYRFYDDFPEVNTTGRAIEPLRYLTTEKEFSVLKSYENYKIAIDSFWLEHASYNTERAKKMIKRFYTRVEMANREFTSYHEGWKTDRGLIYIIYGPPSEVYRKNGEEEWIYGERGNPLSIRFFFDQVENPFTVNDFSLRRSPVYKSSWIIAVENWRR